VIVTLSLNPAIDIGSEVAHVKPSGKLRCGVPRWAPGGGGVNVSRTIAALGGRSTAIFTHGGPNGDRLVAALAAVAGIDCRPVTIRGETRENVLVRETASGHEFHFVMPGPELADAEWHAVLDELEAVEQRPDYVVVSGELARSVPVDFYARVADIVRRQGGRLVVDTRGAALRRALDTGVWMVKPNVGELAELLGADLGDERALVAAARSLVDGGGAEVVLLSLGRGGAVLTTRDEAPVHLRSPVVRQASRVGAGDATVGGMVLALERNASLRDAVEAGMVAGAATVMTPAFDPLRPADVERLTAQLRVPAIEPEGVLG
jgi:6-phosphofructokinase 2